MWIGIVLAFAMIAAVCAVAQMDLNKENDTIIYAKFLTQYKGK